MVREIRDFGKSKEEARLTRVEREKAWQEKQQAQEQAEAEQAEAARKKAEDELKLAEAMKVRND